MKKNIYENFYSQGKRLDLTASLRVQIMVEMIKGQKLSRAKILDVGCYDGTFLSLIKNSDNELYGIEASDYGFSESEKKGIRVKKFFFDDVSNLPFEDGFFDVVTAGEIIEHIYDTDFFLSQIRRILKKGGVFLVSTPNVASLGRRLLLLLGINPIIETSPNEEDSSGHIRYFTFNTLKSLLKKHSLEILACRSDVINLDSKGRLKSALLAKIFPSFGQSIICFCRKS